MPEVEVVYEELTEEEKRWALWRLERAADFPAHRTTPEAVKDLVRRASPGPKQKEPCFVCGRHQRITHSHHLVEVGQVARVLFSWAVFDWAPKIPVVSLCPNHHAYWHEISWWGWAEHTEELNEDESNNIVRLAELCGDAKSRVWAEVRRALPEPPK